MRQLGLARGILVLVLLAAVCSPPSTQARDATPSVSPNMKQVSADGATISRSPDVERYVWPSTASPLLNNAGEASNFAPVSVTLVNYMGSVHVAAELENLSDKGQPAPELLITATYNGKSFGEQSVTWSYPWIEAGEIVMYSSDNSGIYQGSLLVGDWDELEFRVAPGSYVPDESMDTSKIRVEDDKVFNDGEDPIHYLAFNSVVRDAKGVFIGTCWVNIGSKIPPGLFARLPEPLDHDSGTSCFLSEGPEQPMLDALGTSLPHVERWVPVRWVT